MADGKKPLLHELVAVEKDTAKGWADVQTNLRKLFTQAGVDVNFSGLLRSYNSFVDGGQKLPPEVKHVQDLVSAKLDDAGQKFKDHLNVTINKEIGNQSATAVIDYPGLNELGPLPAIALLNLENRLAEFLTLLQAIPVLDPAEKWSWVPAERVWQSEDRRTVRTQKNQKGLILAPADERHPAQSTMITVDEIVGDWSNIKLSSALPSETKAKYLEHATAILREVKQARQRANNVEVNRKEIGKAFLDAIFRE